MAKRSSSTKKDYGAPKIMYAYGGTDGDTNWHGKDQEPGSMFQTADELDNYFGLDTGDIVAVYQLVGYKKVTSTKIGLEDA